MIFFSFYKTFSQMVYLIFFKLSIWTFKHKPQRCDTYNKNEKILLISWPELRLTKTSHSCINLPARFILFHISESPPNRISFYKQSNTNSQVSLFTFSKLRQHKNLFLLHPSSLLCNVLYGSRSTLGTTLAGAAADVMKPPADSWGETPSHLHHLSPPSSTHTHTQPPIDSSTPFKCPSATWASVVEYIQGCFKLLAALPTFLKGNRITCQNKTKRWGKKKKKTLVKRWWAHGGAPLGPPGLVLVKDGPMSSEGTPKWMLRPQWGHHAERKAIRSQLLPPRQWR